MDIQLINDNLLSALHWKARENERKRINFDLRTTQADTSQRMLNALEPGTQVPVHRHLQSSETIVCLEGCFDEVLYEELPNIDAGGLILKDNETVADRNNFVEVARYRICPTEKKYGIQIPQGVWHTIEVHEPSVIFEAKDGAYKE